MKTAFMALALSVGAYLSAVNPNELVVTGYGSVDVKTSVAEIRIGIEAEGKTSGEAQQSVSNRLKNTLDQLRGPQIEKLQTSVLNIYSIMNPANPATVSGYRARIDISFSAPTERAPELIERAFKAGANQLLSLTFKADDRSISVARLNALQAACANALLEARTVSEALGVSASRIIAVQAEPFQPISEVRAADQVNPNVQIAPTSALDIIQREQPLSARVTVHLALER
jgi:uncharacterized protein YggE